MLIKAFLGVVVVVLAPVVAAKLLFNVSTYSSAEPAIEPFSQNRMEFVTWNGEKWTAWIRGDEFVLKPENQSDWHQHANSTLAFFDWEGNPMQARIEGESFVFAHHGDWQGHVNNDEAIRYRDWNGSHHIRTVDQLRR